MIVADLYALIAIAIVLSAALGAGLTSVAVWLKDKWVDLRSPDRRDSPQPDPRPHP